MLQSLNIGSWTLNAAVWISMEISTLNWNSSSIHLLLCYRLWNMNFSFYYFWGEPLFGIWSGVGEEFEQNMIHEIFKSNISVLVVNSYQLHYLVLIKLKLNLFDRTFPQLYIIRNIFDSAPSFPFYILLSTWKCYLLNLNVETATDNIFRLLKAEFCSPHNGEYNVK